MVCLQYLMCSPRQVFVQCGPEKPKGWTLLVLFYIVIYSTNRPDVSYAPSSLLDIVNEGGKIKSRESSYTKARESSYTLGAYVFLEKKTKDSKHVNMGGH